LCAWLTLLPATGLLPHISHTLDILLFPFVFINSQISIYHRDAEIDEVKLFFLSADPRGISFAFHRAGIAESKKNQSAICLLIDLATSPI
jgi:hypothetical protein